MGDLGGDNHWTFEPNLISECMPLHVIERSPSHIPDSRLF